MILNSVYCSIKKEIDAHKQISVLRITCPLSTSVAMQGVSCIQLCALPESTQTTIVPTNVERNKSFTNSKYFTRKQNKQQNAKTMLLHTTVQLLYSSSSLHFIIYYSRHSNSINNPGLCKLIFNSLKNM